MSTTAQATHSTSIPVTPTSNQEPASGQSPEADGALTELLARSLLLSEFQASGSIARCLANRHQTGSKVHADIMTAAMQYLNETIAAAQGGDRSGLQRMALSQAATLDTVFHQLLNFGLTNLGNTNGQSAIKLALRAQAQSLKALQALPDPKPESHPVPAGKPQTAESKPRCPTPTPPPQPQPPAIKSNGHHHEIPETNGYRLDIVPDPLPINGHGHKAPARM